MCFFFFFFGGLCRSVEKAFHLGQLYETRQHLLKVASTLWLPLPLVGRPPGRIVTMNNWLTQPHLTSLDPTQHHLTPLDLADTWNLSKLPAGGGQDDVIVAFLLCACKQFSRQRLLIKLRRIQKLKCITKKKKKKVKGSANKFLFRPSNLLWSTCLIPSQTHSRACLLDPTENLTKASLAASVVLATHYFSCFSKWIENEARSSNLRRSNTGLGATARLQMICFQFSTSQRRRFLLLFPFFLFPIVPSFRVVQLQGISQEVTKVFTLCT